MADRVVVTFVAPWGSYNAGETAGFNSKRAAWLVENKYARPFVERAAVQKEEKPKAAPKAEKPAKPKRRGRSTVEK